MVGIDFIPKTLYDLIWWWPGMQLPWQSMVSSAHCVKVAFMKLYPCLEGYFFFFFFLHFLAVDIIPVVFEASCEVLALYHRLDWVKIEPGTHCSCIMWKFILPIANIEHAPKNASVFELATWVNFTHA